MTKHLYDISYLTSDSIQEGVGSSQITPLLIGLINNGLKVSLLSFEKKVPNAEFRNFVSSSGISWFPQPFGSYGVLGGVKRLNVITNNAPDGLILHGRSDLPTAAAVLKKSDSPILWDVRSLWSDQRTIIGTKGWNTFSAIGARKLEDISAVNALGLNTLTKAVVPILEKRHNKIPKIRTVIPTCVDLERFCHSIFPSEPLTCLLSGTFNNYYDLEKTRDFITALRNRVDLRVIWARGHEALNTNLGVGEDIVVTASHHEMPKLVAESHFGIAICKDEHPKSLAAAVPTKIGEFLASGRPVVISRGIGDLDEMFSGHEVGVIIPAKGEYSISVDRLLELLNNSKTPENCREFAIQFFDMSAAVEKYIEMYSILLKKTF